MTDPDLTPEQRAALAAEIDGANGANPSDPIAAAEELGELLALPAVGLQIRGARIVGRGSTASADLRLSDGSTVLFPTLRDFANPSTLTVEIAATTGAAPKLTKPMGVRALVLLRAVAEHQQTVTEDDLSTEWGRTYLQAAGRLDLDMSDQAARWQAFSRLNEIDPHQLSREHGTIASRSIVLVHQDGGERYVRCGWFRDYVRRDEPSASPAQIAHRMERVGWIRRGRHGRVKATRPGNRGALGWTFYVVPAAWEDAP